MRNKLVLPQPLPPSMCNQLPDGTEKLTPSNRVRWAFWQAKSIAVSTQDAMKRLSGRLKTKQSVTID
jgi:hypothetical protein